MKKSDVVQLIFRHHGLSFPCTPSADHAEAYAPTNIALCKYWGKRDTELHLPTTSSLSLTLPTLGSRTHLTVHQNEHDLIVLNQKEIPANTEFYQKLISFLNLFRQEKNWRLHINITMNIPSAAGFASSAAGFASVVIALNELCQWKLPAKLLTVLARLGSGSAARSFWPGFVEWHAGVLADGMDSFGEPLPFSWKELRVGILTISRDQKIMSSREAMQHCMDSSPYYSAWPKKVIHDLAIIKQAIKLKSFPLFGGVAESNALAMHATAHTAWPPISYSLPETVAAMHRIWKLRREGLEVYFTQDAGANLKLLFLSQDEQTLKKEFAELEVVQPFSEEWMRDTPHRKHFSFSS